MKKLAISILTYNRSKHIREDLAAIAQPTREHGIDIYIYDGSTDERTEHLVHQYIAKGYKHIHYFHADKQISSIESVCQRVSNALHMPDAEYVWMCGDKFLIRPEHYSKIISYIEKSYDIITIYGNLLKGTRRFTKVSNYVDYAIVPITHWGSTIIKKDLITSYKIRDEMKKTPSFCVQSVYLKAIANCDPFKGVVIDVEEHVNIESRFITPSSSLRSMWLSWIINWCHFIETLPSAYDTVRERLYNRPDLQMGFFSLRELLRQRSEGQFGCKLYLECREYVKKVIVMPGVFVFCISLIPQSVAKWLWMNYKRGQKICSWVKNGVRLIGEKLR